MDQGPIIDFHVHMLDEHVFKASTNKTVFTGFGAILAVYVLSGLMRAVVIVANAVGLVQDVDETKVRRGVASAIYNSAGDLGNILGPAVGGLIAHLTSIGGVFVFGSVGATVLFLMGIVAVRRLQRTPQQ